jgi:hypothetical protein
MASVPRDARRPFRVLPFEFRAFSFAFCPAAFLGYPSVMKRALTMLGVLAIGLMAAVPLAATIQTPATPPAQAPPPPPPPAVKVGEPMPDFSLSYLEPPAEAGARPQSKTAKLSDFKGKQVVVLAFFPAAFSPG